MSKAIVIVAGLAAAAALPAIVQAAPQGARTEHAPPAKLSMDAARAIALRAAPGQLISSEYENEGGSWRYSFDIQQNGNVQEVGVDANSGKIIENKSEGPVDKD